MGIFRSPYASAIALALTLHPMPAGAECFAERCSAWRCSGSGMETRTCKKLPLNSGAGGIVACGIPPPDQTQSRPAARCSADQGNVKIKQPGVVN